MMKALINALQISVILGDAPQFAPIGNKYCQTGSYYFATSYYTKYKSTAKADCKNYNCDVIIEWTRINSRGDTFTGWDSGI